MSHGRHIDDKTSKLHEKALGIIYNYTVSYLKI